MEKNVRGNRTIRDPLEIFISLQSCLYDHDWMIRNDQVSILYPQTLMNPSHEHVATQLGSTGCQTAPWVAWLWTLSSRTFLQEFQDQKNNFPFKSPDIKYLLFGEKSIGSAYPALLWPENRFEQFRKRSRISYVTIWLSILWQAKKRWSGEIVVNGILCIEGSEICFIGTGVFKSQTRSILSSELERKRRPSSKIVTVLTGASWLV